MPLKLEPVALQAKFLQSINPDKKGWQAIHVLADRCQCSADVAFHLLKRGRDFRLVAETVIFIGHDPDRKSQLTMAGFRFLEMSGNDVVNTIGIESAPNMVLVDPDGLVKYAGGYYEHRERTKAMDSFIITQTMADMQTGSLPSFGCAISRRLQAATDPLGLKYSPENVEIEP